MREFFHVFVNGKKAKIFWKGEKNLKMYKVDSIKIDHELQGNGIKFNILWAKVLNFTIQGGQKAFHEFSLSIKLKSNRQRNYSKINKFSKAVMDCISVKC